MRVLKESIILIDLESKIFLLNVEILTLQENKLSTKNQNFAN